MRSTQARAMNTEIGGAITGGKLLIGATVAHNEDFLSLLKVAGRATQWLKVNVSTFESKHQFW